MRTRGRRPVVGAAIVAVLLLLVGVGGASVRAGAESSADPRGTGIAAEGEHADTEHAGGHGAGIQPKSLALQLFNFAVLLAILIKLGGGAINKALGQRHAQLKADLAAAAEARAEAEARLRRQDERLAGLEREIAAMRAEIRQEAQVEKTRLIATAEERARRTREETAFAIEQQVKDAQAALRREVASAAVRVAEELLKRAVNPGDQQRLLDGFINDVSGSPVSIVEKAV